MANSGTEIIRHAIPDVAGEEVIQNYTAGEGHVTLPNGIYVPKEMVIPTDPDDSDALAPEWALSALTGEMIYGVRIAVGAGDDVIAGNRLANNGLDVVFLNKDQSIVISSLTAITRLDIVGIATATVTSTHCMIQTSTTEADYRTAAIKFNFASGDDVRRVVVTLSEQDDNTTVILATLTVKGFKNG